MSYAHSLGTMYELCSYYDNGFIMDELSSYISCMTFILIPNMAAAGTSAVTGIIITDSLSDLHTLFLSLYLSLNLSLYLSFDLSLYLPLYLFMYLSLYLPLYNCILILRYMAAAGRGQ